MRGTTTTNDDVAMAFVHGRPKATQNLASIRLSEQGLMVLVGHAHAALAVRHSDGTIRRYNGWYGRSNTTSTHLNLLDGFVNDEVDERPEVYEVVDQYCE